MQSVSNSTSTARSATSTHFIRKQNKGSDTIWQTQMILPRKDSASKNIFGGIKIELKKVVWPTKSELASYTGVVIFTCALCAVGFVI